MNTTMFIEDGKYLFGVRTIITSKIIYNFQVNLFHPEGFFVEYYFNSVCCS